MAYNVKPVDIHEEIFFHQIQVAQEIVRKICPSGPSPSVPVQQPAERDRNSFSPKSPSRFAQPPYGSGRQKLEQPVLAARSTVQTPLSFYEPMKQQEGQSSVSGAIVEILKNTSAIKPQGMTDDEILITLIGKGMSTYTIVATMIHNSSKCTMIFYEQMWIRWQCNASVGHWWIVVWYSKVTDVGS